MESISHLNITGLPKIFFGAGKFNELSEIIRTYGLNALIFIGGESLKKSGRLKELILRLNQAQIKVKIISVWDEPATDAIDAVASQFRKTLVDVVIAIGGGSVIDFGKAVSAMLPADGSVKDYLEGVGTKKPPGAKVPFIALPTTAGTGCEATKNAVICDRKEGYKKSLRHDAYMPDVALVDPELTLTLPRHITIACGLDALSQLIEAYTSTKADASLDALVLKSLSCVAESLLPLALGQSNDIALRTQMSYAALVSGIALTQSGLGAVHGLAGPLGGLCPVPHGIVCGKLLFPVMSFVIKKCLEEKNVAAQKRFADIGKIFAGNEGHNDIFFRENQIPKTQCIEICKSNPDSIGTSSGGDHEDYLLGCKQFLEILNTWTRTLKLPQLGRFGMTAERMERTIELADSKKSPAILSKEEMKVVLEVVR